ncbi:Maf family nucleotide pyrophosphatase [Laribacter hongkongensis]|uniref:Maf family protein n=1 Tax=Laribacter hongkongensis TaxID=168471 RepID=UPI001EFCB569|nr:nucleoside triphosphate pyrophosphatase [Laribacter hongkongensis]MCG8993441.1 Maf family nucleotide pyrophosphatase [Laribacter hongkongensis]MCG8999408.1 Maf family nucleotide pyrophosphatase [Laribacter hongkongensis]MCG9000377.1 Maf family nucleotide pyrophosphatase [Laribacter hongkongensis]MCG9003996.1 Maf family nucleotide pyrophosphatase [Laribacter hongkongensis]MCG9006237.1 Maf family nucleotide pyrophosphatase [Laribacter hongkongensis]
MRLVLASTSRFRREMLSRLGLPFEALAPVCDETPLPGESALDTACRLARIKARSLGKRCPDALIIGSDQVALLDGEQLGKPGSVPAAIEMLRRTRGRELVFHTALALYDARCDVLRERVDITTVRMRNLTDGQIAAYLEREPDAIHCAGGCMSEKLGGALIARIDSTDPNALIGLPLFDLVDLLLEAGVEVL